MIPKAALSLVVLAIGLLGAEGAPLQTLHWQQWWLGQRCASFGVLSRGPHTYIYGYIIHELLNNFLPNAHLPFPR